MALHGLIQWHCLQLYDLFRHKGKVTEAQYIARNAKGYHLAKVKMQPERTKESDPCGQPEYSMNPRGYYTGETRDASLTQVLSAAHWLWMAQQTLSAERELLPSPVHCLAVLSWPPSPQSFCLTVFESCVDANAPCTHVTFYFLLLSF